jgi:hypothetical protein
VSPSTTSSYTRRRARARGPVALCLLLILLVALAAVGTASGRPQVSVHVPLRSAVPQAQTAATAARTVSTSAFGADVSFWTSVPTTGRVAYGIGSEPALFSASSGPTKEHRVHLSGLRPGTSYRAVISVASADGQRGTTEMVVKTAPLPRSGQAGMAGGALTVDGEPFFPILVFGQCDTFDQSLRRGVNLFQLGGCHHEDEAKNARELAGHALVAPSTRWGNPVPGQIAWAYPDEADEHGGTYDSLPALPPWQQTGKVSFLTLTNHFYSNADPLPQGKGMYPGLAKRADMLGFDLYPLQVWCQRDGFRHVYLAQRALDELVKGRPTYQWIETAKMQCPDRALKPTAATVVAETWLAIAGGADGIGWFPWNPASRSVSIVMKRLAAQIAALQPALLAPELPASATSGSGVYVGARQLNGAIYVIAVNATRSPVTTSITMPGLANRPLQTLFEPKRLLTTSRDRFVDSFAPLQAHVYVYAPDVLSS